VTASDYVTVAQLKAVLAITKDTFNDALQLAASSASRQIDRWYGDQFYLDPAPTARVLRPETFTSLRPGVFATTEDLVVETDEDADGTFETTWDPSQWQPEPLERMDGRPFSQIVAVGTRWFPAPKRRPSSFDMTYFSYGYEYPYYGGFGWAPGWGGERRARVRVTARWGWPVVPPEVCQAARILAIDHYKSKDFTNGSAGSTGLSTGAYGGQRGVQVTELPFNPLAATLLRNLRDPVLA